MVISRRRHRYNLILGLVVIGVLMIVGMFILNRYFVHWNIIDEMCRSASITMGLIMILAIIALLVKNKGIRGLVTKLALLDSIEKNLLSIGAYKKIDGSIVGDLPKIKIEKGMIRISLKDLKTRSSIEKYLDSFSTALPKRYIVEDYYISKDNSEVIICYEDIRNYQPEKYTLSDYKHLIKSLNDAVFYFDRKHTVDMNDYPHLLISGGTGSGKSYLSQEIVIQAIIKGWEIVILDIKRSYGLYRSFSDYCYEVDDIMEKLKSVEIEMGQRMEKLQPLLDQRPGALATEIGYRPMLVVIEEYISLQASMDKKKKEDLERIVKNLSVLARQSDIHLMLVMQSAGTDNIQSTTRSNLTKVLLGNAQSNILTATFGTGVDIPTVHTKMGKGEGLIQLDRITVLRVPEIADIDDFKDVIGGAP